MLIVLDFLMPAGSCWLVLIDSYIIALLWLMEDVSLSLCSAVLLAAPTTADVREPLPLRLHLHQELGTGSHRGYR